MGLNILIGVEIFYPQINGIITTTLNLIKNFRDMGHNPIIITPQVVKDSPAEIDGIPIHYISSSDIFTYPGLRMVNTRNVSFKKLIEAHNTDIIQTTAPWFIAGGLHKVGKKLNIPMIMTFHTNLHDVGYMQYIAPYILNQYTKKFIQASVWAVFKKFMNPVDVLIAPSPNTCDDLREIYPKKRIEWIANGVNIDMFIKPPNKTINNDFIPPFIKEKTYALFIGRQAKEKSINLLLEATSYVIDTAPDFQLVLVGDGPKFSEYQRLAKKLGLVNNTTFLGKIEHEMLIKSRLIHNARFFTTASLTETHSMTVTEALCCGIPLVLAEHSSMTYFTEETAFYFKPSDALSMSEALLSMWQDDKEYAPRKKKALTMFKRFDGKSIAQKYLDLYKEILNIKKKQ